MSAEIEVKREAASKRAQDIRNGMRVLAQWRDNVITAYAERDWEALGYDSWKAYVDGEFGEHRVKLDGETRKEIIGAMDRAGMSQRAIATAVGTGRDQVRRAIQVDPAGPPAESEPRKSRGRDGKAYPARRAAPEPTPVPPAAPEPARTVAAHVAALSVKVAPVAPQADARRDGKAQKVMRKHLPELQEAERDFIDALNPDGFKRLSTEQLKYWRQEISRIVKTLARFQGQVEVELMERGE